MARGIVRKIDELGRVTLPKELRDTYGIQCGDPLGMLVGSGAICLIKPGEKFVGIVRNVDPLGRYVLPKETRKMLALEAGQEVDIYYDRMTDSISIRKYGCEWCDETDDLVEIQGHHLCRKCAMAITAKMMGGRV